MSDTVPEATTTSTTAVAAAVLLWVLVTVALGYGVVMTTFEAAALFTA